MPITRRNLLAMLPASTFFLTATPPRSLALEVPTETTALAFPQGVASGDPQPDGIMLWTRAVPLATGTNTKPLLLLQLSTNSDFSSLVLQSQVQTAAENDYTLRAYIDGLTPDTQYYFRFLGAQESVSRTGRTRTAPTAAQAKRVNLAFASCQSYEQAYYGSWARMLEEDQRAAPQDRIHFVLHVGDFIYERCWHKRIDGTAQARKVPPFPDGVDTAKNRYAVSLADYRHLYKTYLSDPHLQAARANWPFICTWDDHEFSNDNFQSYATYDNHNVESAARKQDSNQAWFEFIPTVLSELQQPAHDFKRQALGHNDAARNAAAVSSLCIYRKLSWGKNLDIVLTDGRSYRSPPSLPDGFAASLGLPLNTVDLVEIADGGRDYNNGNPPAMLPYGESATVNPAKDRSPGTMLGPEQRQWFLNTLSSSAAHWKLWGNALPLIAMRLDMSSIPLSNYQDSIFNIDGWAGYPHELTMIMQFIEENEVTGLVSLSGDHHMHGAGTINRSASDTNAPAVAADFSVAGISSSPVFEDLCAAASDDHPDFAALVFNQSDDTLEPVWHISMLDGVFAALAYSKTGSKSLSEWLGPNAANPGLRYVDTTVNGYGLATFDTDCLQVQLVAMEDCREKFKETPAIRHIAGFKLPRWHAGEEPQLAGPDFIGGATFPFQPPEV